jgi:hypothetical protein
MDMAVQRLVMKYSLADLLNFVVLTNERPIAKEG